MAHVVTTTSRLVTSNDDLPVSLERVESIVIESMFYNDAGELRHAWVGGRRNIKTFHQTRQRISKIGHYQVSLQPCSLHSAER